MKIAKFWNARNLEALYFKIWLDIIFSWFWDVLLCYVYFCSYKRDIPYRWKFFGNHFASAGSRGKCFNWKTYNRTMNFHDSMQTSIQYFCPFTCLLMGLKALRCLRLLTGKLFTRKLSTYKVVKVLVDLFIKSQ